MPPRVPGVWRGWLSVIVGVVALLAFASYAIVASVHPFFGHDSPEVLRAMKRDPVGAYVPPFVIGRASVIGTDAGEAMGQPSYARLYRSWQVPRRAAKASFSQAVRDVKARGWRLGQVTYERGADGSRDRRPTFSRSVRGDNRYRTRLPLNIGLALYDPRSRPGQLPSPSLTITISLDSPVTDMPRVR